MILDADFKPREGVAFEWIDPPGTPNRRWRARMHRSVFVQLVRERLGIENPAMAQPERSRQPRSARTKSPITNQEPKLAATTP